jgi:uracil-DNA glycosylase
MAIGFASAIFCTPTKSDRSWRQPSKAEIKNCSDNLDMVVNACECTYVVRVGKITQKIKLEGTTTVDIPYPITMLLSGCNDSEAYKRAVCELSNIPPF